MDLGASHSITHFLKSPLCHPPNPQAPIDSNPEILTCGGHARPNHLTRDTAQALSHLQGLNQARLVTSHLSLPESLTSLLTSGIQRQVRYSSFTLKGTLQLSVRDMNVPPGQPSWPTLYQFCVPLAELSLSRAGNLWGYAPASWCPGIPSGLQVRGLHNHRSQKHISVCAVPWHFPDS